METEESNKQDSSVVVAPAGDIANAAANEMGSEDEFELYVGDTITIKTPDGFTVTGQVYYLDEDRLRLLVKGTTHRLQDFDTSIFEELEEAPEVVRTKLTKFVDILDLKQDTAVQTFVQDFKSNEVTSGNAYKIKTLDEENDSVDLIMIDSEGNEVGDTPIHLDFTVEGRVVGIPLGTEFSVMRPHELPKAPSAEEQDTEPAEEEADLDDILDEEEGEQEEKEQTGLFIGEVLEKDLVYDDETQKGNFLEVERSFLKPAQRENPRYLTQIRRLMESCFALRNDLVDYTDGIIEQKQTTYNTLAELIQRPDFPLAKQVLNVYKTLYFDHSTEYFESKKVGEEFLDPYEIDVESKTVQIEYLEEAVKSGMEFLDQQMKKPVGSRPVQQLPRFFEALESFYKYYFNVIGPIPESNTLSQIEYDRDFFRFDPFDQPPPEVKEGEEVPPVLKGLKDVGDNEKVVGVDSIIPISLSYMRSIKSREGKWGDRKLKIKGIVEQGDEAQVLLFVLFPFLFLRDLGALRSGKLAIDVGNGLSAPKTIKMILEESDGIQMSAVPDKIFAVEPQGNTVGNIEVSDWLKGQALYGNGIGDLLPYMKSIGLSDSEFTPTQFEVLLKKVKFYQANLLKFLKESREKISKTAQKPSVLDDTFNFLDEAESKLFLDALISQEAILSEKVEEFKLKYPAWQNSDLGIFAYLFTEYPDYVLASLSGIARDVALERNRAVNDMALKRLHEDIEWKVKQAQRGNKPIINECDHVKNLNDIRLVSNDDDRTRLMIQKLLPMFQGKTEDHWIFCRICKDHLICEHEYLMLLEKVHPMEKNIIHKKILLKFSGGLFNGKYICKNCGQPIQDLEFEQKGDRNDEGTPIEEKGMTGEMETTLSKELDKLLDIIGDDVTTKPKVEKSEDQDIRVKILMEISMKVGVQLSIHSLQRMLKTIDRLVQNRPFKTEKAWDSYVKQQKNPKDLPSYDQYTNQDLIAICGASVLIEIQSAIPDYRIRTVVEGCKNPTFEGFPLNPDPTQVDAMRYISCAIAQLIRMESPWKETQWIYLQPTKKEGYTKREGRILILLNDFVNKMMNEAEIQTLIEKKREFLIKEKGETAVTGRYAEQIPTDFFPIPIVVSKEQLENAEAPTVSEAAPPATKAYDWILEGHKLALKDGIYEKGNPLSEATCCYSSINTPMEFWKKQTMPTLNPKAPPIGPRGSLLTLKMKVRDPENLLGNPQASLMYRLFLRVCFPREGIDNPRVGLPHEPGFTNKCPYCEFQFPVDPRITPILSYSKDKQIQKIFDAEYKNELAELEAKEIEALTKVGVVQGNTVEKKDFETLLQATYRQFLIPIPPPKTVTVKLQTLDGLSLLNPEPFIGFTTTMRILKEELRKLPSEASVSDIREKFGPISSAMRTYREKLEEFIRTKLPRGVLTTNLYKEISFLSDSPTQTIGETLRTFLLLPIERALQQDFSLTSISDKRRKAIYKKVATIDREKIREFFKLHLKVLPDIQKILEKSPRKDLLKTKLQTLIQKLTVVIPLFLKVLRPNVIPLGSDGLTYIKNAILYGMLWELVDPDAIGGSNDLGMILRECLAKAREPDENTILSPEEIKKIISADVEREKMLIIQELDRLAPEAKRAEMAMKALRLGRWSRGEKITEYSAEQQEFEIEKMIASGKSLFSYGEQAEPQEGGSGYDVGAPDDEGE